MSNNLDKKSESVDQKPTKTLELSQDKLNQVELFNIRSNLAKHALGAPFGRVIFNWPNIENK